MFGETWLEELILFGFHSNILTGYISAELYTRASCRTVKALASSTLDVQTVHILLLTPGSDACFCLTGRKNVFLRTERILLSLRHKYMCMNAKPGLGNMRLCSVKRELQISRSARSSEVPKAACSA